MAKPPAARMSKEAKGYGSKFSPYIGQDRPFVRDRYSGIRLPKLLPENPVRPPIPVAHAWGAYSAGGLRGANSKGPGHRSLAEMARGGGGGKAAGKAKPKRGATSASEVPASAAPSHAGGKTSKSTVGKLLASVTGIFGGRGASKRAAAPNARV